jgi:hypothetical protein
MNRKARSTGLTITCRHSAEPAACPKALSQQSKLVRINHWVQLVTQNGKIVMLIKETKIASGETNTRAKGQPKRRADVNGERRQRVANRGRLSC